MRTAGPPAEAVLIPPPVAIPGFAPASPGTGVWGTEAGAVAVIAGLGEDPEIGVEGAVPTGLAAPPETAVGRGGNEILMVSLRRSAGGLGAAATGVAMEAAGTPGGLGADGIPGTPGGLGSAGTAEATGVGGFGMAGGVNRMVSFLSPGGTGAVPDGFGARGVANPGGLGRPGGVGTPGGLGGAGIAGAPGGLGGVGGKGAPSGIMK